MSGIVCAIRGGPASQPTIDKAITLSRETGLTLYFLYIVNLDFFSHTASSRTHLISKEMEQMGDFILLKAQASAESKGVEAKTVIRHGKVGAEIIDLCREIGADFAVLGRPKGQDNRDVFTHGRLGKFGQRLEKESGTKIVFAD